MEEQTNFEKLRVYQQSLGLVKILYKITKDFPKEELYGLTSQLRRAATSVSLNIAEGQGRSSRMENKQFLLIARGSLHEILAITEITHQETYLSDKERLLIRHEIFSLLKQLNNLISYLKT